MNRDFFYSVNRYNKEQFKDKVYKISLNGGMTCPNRDGTLGYDGCIFCSRGGSGDFAPQATLPISEQIDASIKRISAKYKGGLFIGYFQAFTNTYGPVEYLEKIFTEAISDPRIVGLSIATRPDCLEDDKITLLKKLNRIKPVTIELGLQTSNETTAKYINRGYSLEVFDDCVRRLKAANINIVAHMIVGLPKESVADYMATANHIASLGINGIKIQLLHILRDTRLADDYASGKFDTLTLSEYVTVVVDIIEALPPNMVIHRITGDGPKNLLIAPLWSADKKNVLNSINREFRNRNTYQGKEYR